MVAAYKANPSLTAKSQASTINHCEYFVQTFKDLAAKSQELAQLHDQMAKDAEQRSSTSTGRGCHVSLLGSE